MARTFGATSGEPIETWTNAAVNVKCRLDEANGQEIRTANNVYVKASHVLFMQADTGGIALNEKDNRIKIGATVFNILLVKDAGGAGHHKELLLERIF
jgi:hypothetical protein